MSQGNELITGGELLVVEDRSKQVRKSGNKSHRGRRSNLETGEKRSKMWKQNVDAWKEVTARMAEIKQKKNLLVNKKKKR